MSVVMWVPGIIVVVMLVMTCLLGVVADWMAMHDNDQPMPRALVTSGVPVNRRRGNLAPNSPTMTRLGGRRDNNRQCSAQGSTPPEQESS